MELIPKRYFSLGQAPKHITEKELVRYFLYAFEFSWCGKVFESIRDNIESFYSQQLQDIKSKVLHPLLIQQEWWALVLIALKELSTSEKLRYAQETIQFLLNHLDILSEEELMRMANSINDVFFEQMPDALYLRPLVMKSLHSDAPELDKSLSYFLNHKERFLSMIQQVLEQSDVESNYVNQMTLKDKSISEQYSDFWGVYFELFTEFGSAMYEMMINTIDNFSSIDECKEVLKDMIYAFAIMSIQNNQKINMFLSQSFEIIFPLYEELFQLMKGNLKENQN